MNPKPVTKKSARKPAEVFSADEKAAMKALIKERKAAATKAEAESAALDAIAAMQEPDRSIAQRLHKIIKDSAPNLMPKTWYGMPAYANADGKVICFFQAASKFNVRYATFGFQPDANLDAGDMWATSFALKKLTAAEEAKIIALVRKAAS